MSTTQPNPDTLSQRLAARSRSPSPPNPPNAPRLSHAKIHKQDTNDDESEYDSEYDSYDEEEDGFDIDTKQMAVMIIPVLVPMLAKMLGRYVTIHLMKRYFSGGA